MYPVASTSSLSSPKMWSTANDRASYNEAHRKELQRGSEYIDQQLLMARADALFEAAMMAQVSLDDLLAFPIDWCSLAYNFAMAQREQQESATQAATSSSTTPATSSLLPLDNHLGLTFDHASAPRSNAPSEQGASLLRTESHDNDRLSFSPISLASTLSSRRSLSFDSESEEESLPATPRDQPSSLVDSLLPLQPDVHVMAPKSFTEHHGDAADLRSKKRLRPMHIDLSNLPSFPSTAMLRHA